MALERGLSSRLRDYRTERRRDELAMLSGTSWLPLDNSDGRLAISEVKWNLKPSDRVLGVGRTKGFLVEDFMLALLGLETCGIVDIWRCEAMHCEPEVVGPIYVGDGHDELPFRNHSFDAVVCLNALHDFKRPGLLKASQETERHKPVIVIERHVPEDGLASRAKQIWDVKADCGLRTFSLKDEFIHTHGSRDDLLAAHGISVPKILAAVS
jgi:hypothetical protein